MRIALFALAALTCSVSFADMPADATGQQAASTQAAAAKEQNEAQQKNENGNEAKNESEAKNEAVVVEKPLHRHPTLLSMLRRNNEIRRRLGLAPHRINPALTKAAQDHA